MFRPDPKKIKQPKEKKPLKRTPLKKKFRKATGELELFKTIYEERPHLCEKCGRYIWDFNVANYHHLKHKSTHPELRLDKTNITLVCIECHNNYHL